VEDSILFHGVDIGRRARVRRAIIDKNVRIPPEVEIGFDNDLDRERGLQVTESGIVIIAKADGVEHLTANDTNIKVSRNTVAN
jgi:glucose-1-phosphate adenylyltransferase